MSSQTEFSTPRKRLRRRKRLHISEALVLAIGDCRRALSAADGAVTALHWPDLDLTMSLRRIGDDRVLVTGAPTSQELRIVPVFVGRGFTTTLIGCPRCGARRRRLYLPLGRSEIACRVCHRLRYREHAGPDPVEALDAEVQVVQRRLDVLRLARCLGKPARVDGEAIDLVGIRQRVRQLRKLVDQAAPLSAAQV